MKKTKELTNYKRYERIKKSEVFSYTPFDYCEKHGYTYNIRNYLRDVYEVAQYLLRALKTIKLCREDENTFNDYYYVVKSEFSDKDKKAVKILNVGRAIFNELMLLKDSKYINTKLDKKSKAEWIS